MADADPAIAEWATPNRVKKLNTKLNKECKTKPERDMYEPDETDGPLVLDELPSWPEDQPSTSTSPREGDSRIFRPGEHHLADPDARRLVRRPRIPPNPRRRRQTPRRQATHVAAQRRRRRVRAGGRCAQLSARDATRKTEPRRERCSASSITGARRGAARTNERWRRRWRSTRERSGSSSPPLKNRTSGSRISRGTGITRISTRARGGAAEEGKMLASYVVTPAPEWFR